ncbi:MAG: 2-C-methyl-D-erythritol 4-phosphate cytidylyltransferase [Gemmatimonadota bacterium]|nr:2-C-methyl-D-erythritol 4-phosphate cytidylyltransferase [Gemmatimonadota bacterium]
MTAAVVVAAGRGSRVGGTPKQFRDLGGVPLVAWACTALRRHPAVEHVVLCVPPDAAASPPEALRALADIIVPGGGSRRESVDLGLAAVPPAARRVLVHDGARPFLAADLVDRLVAALEAGPGAVVPAVPPVDTVKVVDPAGWVVATPERRSLRCVQTPQAFDAALLRRLHAAAREAGTEASDDAGLAELAGEPVRVVEGDVRNVKITSARDLSFARWWVESGGAAAAGFVAPPAAGGP